MRDINRIDKFCDELKECWKQYPDQRFGQFMCNALGFVAGEKHIDPFFPEEDKMMEYLKEYCGLDKN